jgi:hypothetical protein
VLKVPETCPVAFETADPSAPSLPQNFIVFASASGAKASMKAAASGMEVRVLKRINYSCGGFFVR